MFSNAYKYFLAVAQTGSFHKASLELYVSQPAISKQIKALEQKLGYPLFTRTTRSVHLTPEGKVLYTSLLECIEIMNKAEAKIAKENTRASLSGTLRIGMLSNWGIDRFRMPYITDFFKSNPGVELLLARMDHRDLIERLRQNKLDIIIIPLHELNNEQGISYITIGQYQFVLILSTSHPLASYDNIWDKLNGINLYTHHHERTGVIGNLEKLGIHPNVILTPNVDSKIAAAENGQGCTVVLSCSKAAASPSFRAYPIEGHRVNLAVAYKNPDDPLIDAFIRSVAELKKQDPTNVSPHLG